MKRLVLNVLLAVMLISAKAEAKDNRAYMNKVAEEYNIAPEMIEALIERESRWVEDAENGNCKGLMQINGNIHKERMKKLGVTDLMDAKGNILVGVDLLADLLKENSDPYYVLMAYNAGNKGIKRYRQGKYSNYAVSIMERAEELERSHGK